MNWNAHLETIKAGKSLSFNAKGEITLNIGSHFVVIPQKFLELAPPEMVEKAKIATAKLLEEALAASAAIAARYRAEQEEQEAAIKNYRSDATQSWGLAGFYMEEMTGAMFTFSEIEKWSDWAASYLGARNQSLRAARYDAVGNEIVSVPLDRFVSPCANRAEINFQKAVKDLQSYVAERRAFAAKQN